MRTALKELSETWKWRGRRWLAGFVLGLSLGVLAGAAIAVKFDLASRWTVIHFFVLMVLSGVVSVVFRLIEGRRFRRQKGAM